MLTVPTKAQLCLVQSDDLKKPRSVKEKLGRCGEAWCRCCVLFCGFERAVMFVDSVDG
jgi:hypothetical protein